MARPDTKSRHIVQCIRRDIVAGKYRPGARLPPRVQLEQQYNVSVTTMQGVMDRLGREGFVNAQGPLGTFVVTNPPHLNRIACVFPFKRNDFQSSTYWSGLAEAAESHEPYGGFEFDVYFDAVPADKTESWQQLAYELEHDRLAGVMITSSPMMYAGTPLLNDPRLARVHLTGEKSYDRKVPAVGINFSQWVDTVVDLLVEQKRRRVAIIHLYNQATQQADQLCRALTDAKFALDDAYIHSVNARNTLQHERLALLLARARPQPDAYVITDDMIVPGFTKGMMQAGLTDGNKHPVIAYANFPHPSRSHVPATRVGFDTQTIFENGLALLKRQCVHGGNRPSVKSLQNQIVPIVTTDKV